VVRHGRNWGESDDSDDSKEYREAPVGHGVSIHDRNPLSELCRVGLVRNRLRHVIEISPISSRTQAGLRAGLVHTKRKQRLKVHKTSSFL
jgi:hypothetical protein